MSDRTPVVDTSLESGIPENLPCHVEGKRAFWRILECTCEDSGKCPCKKAGKPKTLSGECWRANAPRPKPHICHRGCKYPGCSM